MGSRNNNTVVETELKEPMLKQHNELHFLDVDGLSRRRSVMVIYYSEPSRLVSAMLKLNRIRIMISGK